MTYSEYGLNLSSSQRDKLRLAAKRKPCPVSIRLSHENLSGNDKLLLTNRQIQKINKLKRTGEGGMILEMSTTQLKQNMQKEGGFLPMLAGLAMRALPMVAKTVLPALGVGALSGLGGVAVNKALGSGLYLKKGGQVCCVEPHGKGLYLSPARLPKTVQGDGLYLKRGGKIYDGSGLILGPNSPFKDVPLLGMLL